MAIIIIIKLFLNTSKINYISFASGAEHIPWPFEIIIGNQSINQGSSIKVLDIIALPTLDGTVI